jgi:hypothetical protein
MHVLLQMQVSSQSFAQSLSKLALALLFRLASIMAQGIRVSNP